MKSAFPFLCLVLILLNSAGYYGIFAAMQQHNSASVRQRFDAADYATSETVTLQIPLARPYAPDMGDFYAASGLITYRGEFYQVVKQKFAHDTLTLICFRDHEHKRIQGAMKDYVNTFSGYSGGNATNTTPVIKDYLLSETILFSSCAGWYSEIKRNDGVLFLSPSYVPSLLRPPNA